MKAEHVLISVRARGEVRCCDEWVVINKALSLLTLIESGDYVVVPKEFYVSQDEYDMDAHADMYHVDKAVYEETIEAAQQDEKIRSILDE